ncbi:response regulator transcription factor [Demequina mangrovi]|uniref:DNA-binding response regulator, OmpR family, contains REC and winged-helix (WHTH) domain n=1 Tax=Demequina mangrovi TaxID=1043493 RepID=A0A1H7AWT0_9MICO|nr:response regulator transcription factor [Demequina mangrovi]SEJ66340.1 DNA-binding response regulator, OmpR family, contains REC and winged-helix (wHTH) domain [Demequina mangrovi]
MGARTVLVVDDETSIRDLVGEYLRRDGFEVLAAGSGEDALDALRHERADLVILDVRLPGIDGMETLRRIRRSSSVPVLLLTARAEEADRIVGLELGADDYVTKPFSPREVVARVRAILRRGDASALDDRIVAGALQVDTGAHEATVDGRAIALTALEFDLLAALASAPGRVFTRRQLIERVWGWDFYGDERIVDVHVRKLRRALGDPAEDPRMILTVRGVGYKLAAP